MDDRLTFPKKEHLCGEIRIDHLFKNGKAFIVYPLRIVYRIVDDEQESVPVRVMVSVPKKRFKKAVKRNRLKRLMRESYRLNKNILVGQALELNLHLHVAFNYVSDDELDFKTIENKMKIALQKIADRLN